MALTKVRGGGVDNPLTLGGGAASDRSIIFDGNAQDFHIGLDDSADKLIIGLGSTLGTTSHIVIDANGHVTMPKQPGVNCSGHGGSVSTNAIITGSSGWNEQTDINNDFSNGRFTAPVDGFYLITFGVRSQTSGSVAYAQLRKNGGGGIVGASAIETNPVHATEHHMGGTQTFLSANDYVEVYAAGNVHVDASDHFAISLLS